MDFQVVEELSEQVDHVSADKMYDTDDVYDALTSKFPESDIAIPPKENLYADDAHNPKRMSNLVAYSALGPNFNKHDYVFTYSCGGGAICGNIMSSPDNVLTDFPSEFLVDSQEGEFSMDYDVNSNKICFTGKSAFDSEFYNHECYKFLSGKLIKVVVAQ